MRSTLRCGFSLLEVMLATTVLLGSVIVLSHIAFVGTAHMDAAAQYAAAQLVCQSRMNEMLAGAVPIEEVSGQAIAELPGWGLTVKVGSASQPGLLALEVTASEHSGEAISLATADASTETTSEITIETAAAMTPETTLANGEVTGTGKRFTLVRWIAEPEGSEASSLAASKTSAPLDLPEVPSLFDDTLLPSDSLLPEEPSMFGEPIPEF